MSDTATNNTRVWNGVTIPAPGTYEIDPMHKLVGFVARHMMVAKVRGHFDEASATITVAEDPKDSSVTATIKTASITTGAVDRDAHLRSPDFLKTEEFPTIEFQSLGGVKEINGSEFVLPGELT